VLDEQAMENIRFIVARDGKFEEEDKQ